mgnify:CR=1 FL=1
MAQEKTSNDWQCGADLVVKNLEAQGVKHVFGIPGAKIDRVYEALNGSRIKLVVCRHEQNAAFIAGGLGRLTGKAGVCLVTSGPGVTNLATGLATGFATGLAAGLAAGLATGLAAGFAAGFGADFTGFDALRTGGHDRGFRDFHAGYRYFPECHAAEHHNRRCQRD